MGLDFDLVISANSFFAYSTALTAQAAGAKVALCEAPYSDIAFCSGALDLAFVPEVLAKRGLKASLYEHVEEIAAYHKKHPYARLGVEKTLQTLEKSLALLSAAFAGLLSFKTETPIRFGLSPQGRLVPSWALLDMHVFKPEQKSFGFVDILEDQHCNAKHVIQGIEHDAKLYGIALPHISLIPISFKPALHKNAVQLAKVFDEDAHELVALIGDKKVEGLFLPPVLGVQRYQEIHALLRHHIKAEIIELLGHIPSVSGLRMQHKLQDIPGFTRLAALDMVTQEKECWRIHCRSGQVLTSKHFIADVKEHYDVASHGASLVLGYEQAMKALATCN